MRRTVDSMFDSMFNYMYSLVPTNLVPESDFSFIPTNIPTSFMRTDIIEKDDKYVMNVELPGFKKEDVEITLAENVLEINAKKKEEIKNEEETYIKRERYYGTYSRRVRIPGDVKEDDIKASFTDGVLQIEVPKAPVEVPQKKSINID